MSDYPKFVRSRKVKGERQMTGKVISQRRCTLEGCSGTQLLVEWPRTPKGCKSKRTWPCSKGMGVYDDNTWGII